MVLPIQFDKYLTQNKLADDLELIYTEHLPAESFVSPDGDDINHLRCGVYIFVDKKYNSSYQDLRPRVKPPTTHQDFKLWQYNHTPQAEKYFNQEDYPWDFAVLRQGYGDYSKLYTDSSELDHRKQWIFIQALNQQTLDNLKKIDYQELSMKNLTTPGFGKADLVEQYINQFEK